MFLASFGLFVVNVNNGASDTFDALKYKKVSVFVNECDGRGIYGLVGKC